MLLSTVHDPPARNVNLINRNTADLKKKKNLLLTIINMSYCSLVWEYKNWIFKQKQYF